MRSRTRHVVPDVRALTPCPWSLPRRTEYLQTRTMSTLRTATMHPMPFVPNGPAQAKESISVNYFLNSADAETLAREKSLTQEKVRPRLGHPARI